MESWRSSENEEYRASVLCLDAYALLAAGDPAGALAVADEALGINVPLQGLRGEMREVYPAARTCPISGSRT